MSAPPDPSVSSIPLSTEFRTVSALTFCMLRTNSLRCSPGTPHVRAMRPHFALFCRDLSCLSFSPRIPCISAASFSSHGLTRTVLSNRSGRLHIRAYPSCAPREKPTGPTFLPSPPTHSSSSASASSVWNVLSVCLPNPMMCGTKAILPAEGEREERPVEHHNHPVVFLAEFLAVHRRLPFSSATSLLSSTQHSMKTSAPRRVTHMMAAGRACGACRDPIVYARRP